MCSSDLFPSHDSKEAAEQSQQYSKEMFDYTGYENQVAHMKAAGLNPALLYGNGGGGGATATGGTAIAGQGSAGSAPGGAGPQAIKSQIVEGAGMGIQLGLMNAQKRNLEADATKKEADAAKTAGVDTDLQNANIDYIIAQTSNEKAKKIHSKIQ